MGIPENEYEAYLTRALGMELKQSFDSKADRVCAEFLFRMSNVEL